MRGETLQVAESTPLLESSSNESIEFSKVSSTSFDSWNSAHDREALDSSSLGKLSQSLRRFSTQISIAVAEHTGSIGYLGSYAIAVNSLAGPAMLELPATFAESGFIPTTITLIFTCFLSAFCSLHMANSISKIRSNTASDEEATTTQRVYNHDFKSEVEYSAAFSYYWGRWPWFYVTHTLFWACITCLNISSIVDTAQVVDNILGHTIGTAALQVGQGIEWVFWNSDQCDMNDLDIALCLPFASILETEDTLLLTVGTLVTLILFLPPALYDLKENVFWQVLAFLVLLLMSLQFILQFAASLGHVDESSDDPSSLIANFSSSADGSVSAAGDMTFDWQSNQFWWGHNWENLFGVVLFNFALVIAVPAWLYEREPHVDVPTVIYGSSIFSTILYIAVGCLGRLAMPHVSGNMLASLMSGAYGLPIQIGASIFAFFIIGWGIPLFSVLARLNLIGSGGEYQQPLCSRFTANIFAVYAPFGVSWFLYNGKAVTQLLAWGGTLCSSFVAYILPLSLSLYVIRNSRTQGSIDVYGGIAFNSTQAQDFSLRVLLLLAIMSIIVAIAGPNLS